ncbi:S24 family peptidase [Massilia timonae]|uniref:S24 family peptidase n=1 Tax=Massilia timonae TaxID=47229 RepID=UPI00289B9C21|nr:S24 family peptidase [Massilia timonae]
MNKQELLVRKNLEWLIERAKTSPYELQKTTGVPQPTIHRILTGESTDPRTKTLQPLADFFRVSVADLRDRDLTLPVAQDLAGLREGSFMRVETVGRDDPRHTLIPKVKLRLTAGISGFEVEPELFDGSTTAVPTEWLERKGYSREKLIAITVRGESMEPTFYEGDLVIVNTADQALVDNVVYALNYEGEPVVKRLTRDAGQWWLSSDNVDQRRFYRRTCDESVKIIGRVVRKESEHF